ncbi:MAG: recombination regulator RecX [Xanthomonadales bacterium]|nr:recombination regulator RecX [Xanthomonadales bacterium]
MKSDFDKTAWSAAYTQAVRLLSGREHSQLELRQKMQRKGHPGDLIDAMLVYLQDLDMQSDQRFTEAFIRSRVIRLQGPMKILAQLSQRGIRVNNLEDYLPAEHDWEAMAAEALSRGTVIYAADRQKLLEKAYRRLVNRGFSHGQAMKAAKNSL